MATKNAKTKRMSHANCTHPKTSHERAKCRSRHNAENLKKAARKPRVYKNVEKPTPEPSAQELAWLLSTALRRRDVTEQRLAEQYDEVDNLQSALLNKMVEREPQPTSDGRAPVVAFSKTFRNGTKKYEYSALGVVIHGNRLDWESKAFGEDVYDAPTEIKWYLTCSSGNTASPKNWRQLIEFMGVEGLGTLEVLRAG